MKKNRRHQVEEISTQKILTTPIWYKKLVTINVLFCDEDGNLSKYLMSVIDIILRKFWVRNMKFGGILLMFSMDNYQLAPLKGNIFLVLVLIIIFFQIFKLRH